MELLLLGFLFEQHPDDDEHSGCLADGDEAAESLTWENPISSRRQQLSGRQPSGRQQLSGRQQPSGRQQSGRQLSGRQQCWSPRRLTKAHAAPHSGGRTRLALWLTVVDVW